MKKVIGKQNLVGIKNKKYKKDNKTQNNKKEKKNAVGKRAKDLIGHVFK